MITTRFYNIESDECANSIKWNDDNSAKAFMFDQLMNTNGFFSYVNIIKNFDDSYDFMFIKNDSTDFNNSITIDYTIKFEEDF